MPARRPPTLKEPATKKNPQRTQSCEAFKPSLFPAAQRLRSTNRLAELNGLLEKTKAKNELNHLIWDKKDPVTEAIEAEIQKIERCLKSFSER